MDELDKVVLQIKKENDYDILKMNLEELLEIFTEEQVKNILNKDMEKYSNQLLRQEKIIRSILRHHKADSEEKVFYQTLGESIGIIKFLKILDNNIRRNQNFEKKIQKLFFESDIERIVQKIFYKPNISREQIENEIKLNKKETGKYLDELVSNDMILKYGIYPQNNYELTPLMAEFIHKNTDYDSKVRKKTWINLIKKDTAIDNLDHIEYNHYIIEKTREVGKYARSREENNAVRDRGKELVYSKL